MKAKTRRFTLEIWVKSKWMNKSDLIKNIKEGHYASWGTDGIYERTRICNVKEIKKE